jgi:hypothetical protein
MEESGSYRLVGFFLAIMFAAVMGLCALAVLYTDFTALGGVLNDRERATLRIVALAGASAGLIAWGLQKFAAHRSFAIRLIYGLAIYLLVFCALGGLFELLSGIIGGPGSVDWSLSGLYFLSLGAFYGFTISLLGNSVLALLGLMLAAGIILAAVGPRTIY